MGASAKAPFYRGVRGGAARRIADAATEAEALEPGEMRRVPYRGELPGAGRAPERIAGAVEAVRRRAARSRSPAREGT